MKDTIIVHHEAGNNGFNSVNEYHRRKWNSKSTLGYFIGYQYYIDKDGKLYKGRSEAEQGIHAKGWNNRSIGICLMGNFMNEEPKPAQLNTLNRLIKQIKVERVIKNVYGHRQVGSTLCPGDNLFKHLKKYNSRIESMRAQLEMIRKLILKLLRFKKYL